MKVPLFILGFLRRHGQLHGYRIKQLITEQASDFTRIKLPTIYYHLEQLQKKDYVTSQKEKEGRRPDRTVYKITAKGKDYFNNLLTESLNIRYQVESDLDTSIFFMDALNAETLDVALESHEEYLKTTVKRIKDRRQSMLEDLPDPSASLIRAIFSHQLVHHSAELRWVRAVRHLQVPAGRYVD